jgi:hypothetical protein
MDDDGRPVTFWHALRKSELAAAGYGPERCDGAATVGWRAAVRGRTVAFKLAEIPNVMGAGARDWSGARMGKRFVC